MSRYTLRPKAEEDLAQHEEYLAENASVETARRSLDAIKESLRLLATQPEMGAQRAYRRPEFEGQRMCDRFEGLRTTWLSIVLLTTASM